MSTDSILNFIAIDERIGTAGQPTQAQLEAARAEGYQAVINLAPANRENHALTGEDAAVKALGMSYHHIPVEWTEPKLEQFIEFSDAMDALQDQKLLIHCAANYRVTAFFSLYAMRKLGWSVEQADALMARIWESRPDYRMDRTWKAFVDRVRELPQ